MNASYFKWNSLTSDLNSHSCSIYLFDLDITVVSKALILVKEPLLSYMTFYFSLYESLVYYCIDLKLLLFDKKYLDVSRILKSEFSANSGPLCSDIVELIPTGSILLG